MYGAQGMVGCDFLIFVHICTFARRGVTLQRGSAAAFFRASASGLCQHTLTQTTTHPLKSKGPFLFSYVYFIRKSLQWLSKQTCMMCWECLQLPLEVGMWNRHKKHACPNTKLLLRRDKESISQEGPYARLLIHMKSSVTSL